MKLSQNKHFKKQFWFLEAGEMALRLGVVAALSETLSLIPGPHMTAHIICEGSDALFWLPSVGTSHAWGAHS